MSLKMLRFLLLIIGMFVMSLGKNTAENMIASKDNSGLNGFVKDKKTGETLVGATVFLIDTKFGTRSNKSGYFTINNIPPGTYNVSVSFLGYDKFQKKIELKAGQVLREEFELNQGSFMQEDIYVEAERDVEKRQISISKVNVPVQTIKNIRVGGESDIFRTLQYLPGVLTSSQLSSGLFVRGGSPDQNLVLLDGSTVYNPTHLFGFISTFNTDAIKDVELVKGGFDAEYGGRLSAVLNITQNDGNRKEFEGVASIGVISSRVGLQGPIGNGSWFVSGRRTYFDLVKQLIPEDPETPIPDFGFYDLNGKITQDFGPNDKVSISGFLSNDNLEFSNFGLAVGLDLGNRLISGKWTHIFNEKLFSTMNASYSKYFNNIYGDQSGYEFLIDNTIEDYTIKINTEWFASEDLTAKFGVESSWYNFGYLQNFTGDTDSTAQGSSGGSTNLQIKDFQTAVFGQMKWSITALLSLQAGLRVNYWELSDLITYDPRISARYRLTDKIAIKGAWGIFHQNLRLATQPNFSFFDTWLPTDNTVPASNATHYIISIETEPIPRHTLNFDFYYKDLTNVSELNTNALQGANVGDVFYIGDATAWGAEVFVQKRFGKVNGWVGYALGFISSRFDSINNGEAFRPRYDRTHDFKVVVNYDHNDSWDFGASFFYQTGQSYTGATSRFQTVLPGQVRGRGKIVPSQRFGLRLPPSHQLNLTATYSFDMWGLESKAIIDIYNVYSRRDILVRFYNTQEENTFVEDVRLIPILPTVSLEIRF
ncbi:MAG: TonB-dependent receptor [Candidatus Kapabacteria bacterium]|nr:TonB-dependent receptor [Ignavibacteriota bacterium]MCW5884548.1 TonB-dependent receptor [Candidatus Kapabacteria bacterium]